MKRGKREKENNPGAPTDTVKAEALLHSGVFLGKRATATIVMEAECQ